MASMPSPVVADRCHVLLTFWPCPALLPPPPPVPSDQASAALAAHVQAPIVPSLNFTVRPCPGPDDINWSALWSSWLRVRAQRQAGGQSCATGCGCRAHTLLPAPRWQRQHGSGPYG